MKRRLMAGLLSLVLLVGCTPSKAKELSEKTVSLSDAKAVESLVEELEWGELAVDETLSEPHRFMIQVDGENTKEARELAWKNAAMLTLLIEEHPQVQVSVKEDETKEEKSLAMFDETFLRIFAAQKKLDPFKEADREKLLRAIEKENVSASTKG